MVRLALRPNLEWIEQRTTRKCHLHGLHTVLKMRMLNWEACPILKIPMHQIVWPTFQTEFALSHIHRRMMIKWCLAFGMSMWIGHLVYFDAKRKRKELNEKTIKIDLKLGSNEIRKKLNELRAEKWRKWLLIVTFSHTDEWFGCAYTRELFLFTFQTKFNRVITIVSS